MPRLWGQVKSGRSPQRISQPGRRRFRGEPDCSLRRMSRAGASLLRLNQDAAPSGLDRAQAPPHVRLPSSKQVVPAGHSIQTIGPESSRSAATPFVGNIMARTDGPRFWPSSTVSSDSILFTNSRLILSRISAPISTLNGKTWAFLTGFFLAQSIPNSVATLLRLLGA